MALVLSNTDPCITIAIASESAVTSITISFLLLIAKYVVKKEYIYVAKNV
jgi:hypothetical protein